MSTPLHEIEVPQRCRVIWPQEAIDATPPPQAIHGLLTAGGLALVYGESGTGKSTAAIDLGCAIATGQPWRGRAVRRGLVLHVAGEGMHGLRLRLAAAIREGRGAVGMPYGILPDPLDLVTPGDLADLLELIALAEAETGEKLALLTIDTLARCFGIDENDGSQMRLAIAACDEIRQATKATVLIVHHAGKDTSKGARGHSSLRAAVDTELLVEGLQNPRTLTVTKQRDLPTAEPMAFSLEPVTIGQDHQAHESITACILKHSDAAPPRKAPSGRQQAALLAELERRYAKGEVAWTDSELRVIGRDLGMPKPTARSAVLGLHSARYLIPSVGGATLVQPPEGAK